LRLLTLFGYFTMKALISSVAVLVTAAHALGAASALAPANLVSLIETNNHRLCATVTVTNALSVTVDCSLYVVPQADTRCLLSAGSTSVVWSIVTAKEATNAPAISYTPLMGYRYGLSGPVVRMPSGAKANLESLAGAVSATNQNLLIILQKPIGTPRQATPVPVLAARLGSPKGAEPAAPHEPPPAGPARKAP
jgi:hypothetical protein